MVTDTSTPFLTVPEQWPMLQPAQPAPKAHTKNGQLLPSVSYPLGQALGPHNATVNVYVPPGHAAEVAGSRLLVLTYQYTTDANGNASYGPTSIAGDTKMESVSLYFTGSFFVRDLTGVADGATLARLGKLVQGRAYNDTTAIVELG